MCRILTLIFIVICLTGAAQDKKSRLIRIINAESLSFDRERNNAQVLRGNVICEHEGALLHCDTALIYEETNTMQASGHVLITKGDSIRVTGETLLYDGKSGIATLRNNVKCVEKDMILTTDILNFDVRKSVANYHDGGTIVNKQNTLVSKVGYYYSSNKEAAFHFDVVLTNPEYKMLSDTLKYRMNSKTAYFFGPTTITSETDEIYCENGWYDTNHEKSQFSRNAILRTKTQTLRGDSLVYDRNAGIGRAFRNVSLTDSVQKSVLYGNYIEYRKPASEAFATLQPLYVRITDNDSLFLAADTLYHRDIDSVDNFLAAYHHVKVFKRDLQAVCDSATLSTADSLMQLYESPILWSDDMQATAKHIEIDIGKKSVKGFRLTGKAFIAREVDSLNTDKYQQLSGKTIHGFIRADTIRKVEVYGNAEMYYFPKNKNSLIGLNKTTSSEIQVWFRSGDIFRVTLKPKTTGQIDPMRDVNIENARLKGFAWLAHRRPQSKKELHTGEERAAE